jgi:hypothetical protein
MTNENLGTTGAVLDNSTSSSSDGVDSSSQFSSSSDAVQGKITDNSANDIGVQQEKVLKQSEVNEIVGAVRKEAADRARRETIAEFQKTQKKSDSNEKDSKNISLDNEQIRQIVAEENEKAANQAIANKIALEFTQKMLAAKEKYQDFEEVVSQLNLPNVPELVHWTNSLDNTADVMYDIAKNPSKFANILMLSNTAPHLAQIELQKLSLSIKKNQEAQAKQVPREPLSQITPSTAGVDNGKMTLEDFKKADWLRG